MTPTRAEFDFFFGVFFASFFGPPFSNLVGAKGLPWGAPWKLNGSQGGSFWPKSRARARLFSDVSRGAVSETTFLRLWIDFRTSDPHESMRIVWFRDIFAFPQKTRKTLENCPKMEPRGHPKSTNCVSQGIQLEKEGTLTEVVNKRGWRKATLTPFSNLVGAKGLPLGAAWVFHGPPFAAKWPQNGPFWRLLGTPRPKVIPGVASGSNLGRFWVVLGSILDRFWVDFQTILGRSGSEFLRCSPRSWCRIWFHSLVVTPSRNRFTRSKL